MSSEVTLRYPKKHLYRPGSVTRPTLSHVILLTRILAQSRKKPALLPGAGFSCPCVSRPRPLMSATISVGQIGFRPVTSCGRASEVAAATVFLLAPLVL